VGGLIRYVKQKKHCYDYFGSLLVVCHFCHGFDLHLKSLHLSCICTRIYTIMHTNEDIKMHMCIHACTHTYIQAYTYTHTHTSIHTYIHTYMHTYIYTHADYIQKLGGRVDSAIIWFDIGEQLGSSHLHFHLFNRNPHSTVLSQK